MYLIYETLTGYSDGWYANEEDATRQAEDLKRDYPKGRFVVLRLERHMQSNMALPGSAGDHFRRFLADYARLP